MKHSIKLFVLLATVLCLTACEKDPKDLRNERDIIYSVAEQTSTAHLTTEAEWEALLERFCSYAEAGSKVTFHNANRVADGTTKEIVTCSTTSREEIKAWMVQMEDEGRTVTVTYDRVSRTWHGTAYTAASQPKDHMKRLCRVTMDKSCVKGRDISWLYRPEYLNNYGIHTVHTYTWNGNLLTSVDMEEETIVYKSDSLTVDSVIRVHNTATLAYTNGLRTALYLHDDEGNIVKEYQYTYDDAGRLTQEFQTDHACYVHHVDYYHYKEFLGLDWYFAPYYLNFLDGGTQGLDFYYDSIGNYAGRKPSNYTLHEGEKPFNHISVWSNGDLIRTISHYGIILSAFEYDNSPHPYGVTLGTTSLLPGYNTFISTRTFWSQHNVTHVFGQNPEVWITNTHNADGSIATAEMQWTDGSTIRWTFEYLD